MVHTSMYFVIRLLLSLVDHVRRCPTTLFIVFLVTNQYSVFLVTIFASISISMYACDVLKTNINLVIVIKIDC